MIILVADDHPVNRCMMQMILGAWGHTVDVVEDGALACAATQSRIYDLVLMDLNMPVMDGREAIAVIRARACPSPRLVVVTADNTAASYAACMAAGADGVEIKPVDIAKLSMIMAEAEASLLEKASNARIAI